mmetsp:Transcript_7796/g.12708  ORF Transcript_7796/g.12708 Transcript_7796/m.12708 type:complete len:95 (+) Transcript_7796:201-485(+)
MTIDASSRYEGGGQARLERSLRRHEGDGNSLECTLWCAMLAVVSEAIGIGEGIKFDDHVLIHHQNIKRTASVRSRRSEPAPGPQLKEKLKPAHS